MCLNNYLKLAPGEESEFDRLWAEQPGEDKQVVNASEKTATCWGGAMWSAINSKRGSGRCRRRSR